MRRGELATQAGCHAETVRFYEKSGLLPPPPRSPAGHRIYGGTHLRRLRFIIRCRALGFSLDQVRQLLDLVDREQITCAEVQARSSRQLRSVEAKIRDLERLRGVLKELLARCTGDETPDCAMLEQLFEGAAPGGQQES